MLTAADEWHVHQTPEPIAVAGTDRNFYDRSYFGGWSPDGSLFVAVAFGIYPHLNVADAHVTVVAGGRQHALHCSKALRMNRADLVVGPVRIHVEEPLERIRVTIDEEEGVAGELTFTGRSAAFLEPRFIHRMGTRTFMDYTRMTQSCHVSGWVSVDGERHELAPDAVGARDRSWGVRPVGAPDPQPLGQDVVPSFFWAWSPVHLSDRTTFFHVCSDHRGRTWNTRARVCPDGVGADDQPEGEGDMAVDLRSGSRWARGARIRLEPEDGPGVDLAYAPLVRLQMRGLGYGHPEWAHGTYHGEYAAERESWALEDVDPTQPHEFHVQELCRVEATYDDGRTDVGVGVLEQLVMGPYVPYGLRGLADVVA